jgi:DNA-binding transcriptional LysR family regulator
MIEFFQLRCFVAVATELNFRRAAVRLNMSQPPLSRRIQLLEHQLGVRLLERTQRSVRLTPAGQMFLPEAQALLHRANVVTLSARRIASGDAGSATIGFVTGSSYGLLPHIVSVVQQMLPDVNLVLREMTTSEQVEALAARRIDLGIVRVPFDQRDVASQCLAREEFMVALPRGHRLAKRRSIMVKMLDGERLIMYSPSDWQPFYEMLAGVFHTAGISPKYVQSIASTHTILGLVNVGVGLAVVPQAAAYLHFRDVLLRPFSPDLGIRSEIHLVWQAKSDNPVLPPLRDLIVQSTRNDR